MPARARPPTRRAQACFFRRAAATARSPARRRSRARSFEHSIKVDQHAGGRAPDYPLLVFEHVVADLLALELARAALAVARIEQEGERHLEDLRDFTRVGH